MTEPYNHIGYSTGDQTRLVVAPAWTDPVTGQVYVHEDLKPQAAVWTVEEHISPIKAAETFGDVDSWVKYVKAYASTYETETLLTWGGAGLRATLDYHLLGDADRFGGRCQWTATMPFTRSPEWRAWESFANGTAKSQREAIEKLEDLGEDITDPTESDLLLILRSLRANATARADTEIRPDGTTSVSFSKDTTVSNKSGTLELPSMLLVNIPVLVGDPTPWQIKVRMRVSVDDSAKLALRFSMVNAERVLEAVYAERIAAAQVLLGDSYTLLRAAG